jgi:4-amino-4-deoxy-L-arabinose transferase-like glycosyltransferase
VTVRTWTAAIAIALAACTAGLYGWRLAYAPPHLEIDEVLIGLDAHAIATTGRDLRGERLPLYSQTAEHSWYQPFVIYITALALTVLPLTEWSVRLPTVCIGVLNVLLMFLVAKRVFESRAIGAAAAAMLMLTPAHFLHSRYAMDYMYPATVVLVWLLCLAAYAARPRTSTAVAAAVTLGLGFYSYISSIVMMPLYVLLTLLFLAAYRAPRRTYAAAAGAFVLCLVPFLVWFAGHPGAFGATAEKYGVYDPHAAGAARGLLRSLIGITSVSDRLSMYWNMLSPSPLFLTGGSRVMFSTGRAGVFLAACGFLLPVGLYQAVTARRTPMHLLLAAGFLTAPLPALMVTDENAPMFRALAIVPFGILLSALGLLAVWRTSTPRLAGAPARAAAIGLVAVMPLQFALFRSDYFHDYRVRAAYWLGGNMRGAFETLLDCAKRVDPPAIYMMTLRSTGGLADGRNPYLSAYWQFYATKHGREDLLARTRPFDAAAVDTMAPHSLVLGNEGDRLADSLVASGRLRRIASIPELNGDRFFEILQR